MQRRNDATIPLDKVSLWSNVIVGMGSDQTFSLWAFLHSGDAKGKSPSPHKLKANSYVVALVCVVIAWALRALINPVLGSSAPYAFFGPAAMVAAWYGGIRPGLWTLLVGLGLGYYFFEEPQGQLLVPKFEHLSILLATAVPSAISVWIIELLHRAKHRANAAIHKEREHNRQLEQEARQRERSEEELRLHYEVILETNRAETVSEAFGIALQKICHFTGWSIGHAWTLSVDKTRLELCPNTCRHDSYLEKFSAVSKRMPFPLGAGVLGRVWQSKLPLWVPNVRLESDFLRVDAALEAGLKSALFVPLIANDEVVALFEFFHTDVRPRDERMIQLVTAVGAHVGSVILRKRAEERLRENEQRLKEAQSIAHIGHWDWNIEKDELVWSDELYKLFGVKPDHFAGGYQAFIERVHPEDRSFIAETIKRSMASGEPFSYEYRALRPDGEMRRFESHGAAVRNAHGKVVKMMGTAQDVTDDRAVRSELIAAREKLQEYASLLERKVANRTSDLEKSVKQLESFCYTIAHDLRAPLRAMSGMSNVILEDYAPCLDDAGRDYAKRIAGAAARMDQLIQDLLTYGRLTHGHYERTRVNLADTIKHVLSVVEPQIRQKSAVVQVSKFLPVFTSNPILLEMILFNLVDNALKFVPSGVAPRVEILAEEKGEFVRISITDNGIGIPIQHQNRIFKVFEKLDQSSEYPGTGIGLAIVSKAVERLGGHVGVDSEPGRGSCFWVELPKAELSLNGKPKAADASATTH